jgi:hypothetical protein
MSRFSMLLFSAITLLATACASIPNGPTVMVLPGPGQSFDEFRNDDAICQQFAFSQVGGTTANAAAVESGAASAVVGKALGAAAGAAIGGGRGAAIGAGSGLVAGSLVGTSAAASSRYATQEHYDAAYIQCMYAKGHQVPVSEQYSGVMPRQTAMPMPTPVAIPPPPGALPPAQ